MRGLKLLHHGACGIRWLELVFAGQSLGELVVSAQGPGMIAASHEQVEQAAQLSLIIRLERTRAPCPVGGGGQFPPLRFLCCEVAGSACCVVAQSCALAFEPLVEFGGVRYKKTGK